MSVLLSAGLILIRYIYIYIYVYNIIITSFLIEVCLNFLNRKQERRFKFIATLNRLAVDGILYIRVEIPVVIATTAFRKAADLLLTLLALIQEMPTNAWHTMS